MSRIMRVRIALTAVGAVSLSVGAFVLAPAVGLIVLGATLIYLGQN